MLLAHAILLAESRSYLAALAGTARTVEASIAYERVLLHLDLVHGDQCPAYDHMPSALPADLLYRLAVQAIRDLKAYGVDALQIELVLADLLDAREFDTATDGTPRRP